MDQWPSILTNGAYFQMSADILGIVSMVNILPSRARGVRFRKLIIAQVLESYYSRVGHGAGGGGGETYFLSSPVPPPCATVQGFSL